MSFSVPFSSASLLCLLLFDSPFPYFSCCLFRLCPLSTFFFSLCLSIFVSVFSVYVLSVGLCRSRTLSFSLCSLSLRVFLSYVFSWFCAVHLRSLAVQFSEASLSYLWRLLVFIPFPRRSSLLPSSYFLMFLPFFIYLLSGLILAPSFTCCLPSLLSNQTIHSGSVTLQRVSMALCGSRTITAGTPAINSSVVSRHGTRRYSVTQE